MIYEDERNYACIKLQPRSGSKVMEINAMTSNKDTNNRSGCSSWQQERKLLHWVNSLPPPACLLVETPADLRFGDVLLAILCWLRTQRQRCGRVEEHSIAGDDEGNGALRGCSTSSTALERLWHVLRFVAREARSEDGDAMFVVNEAQCAERMQSGDADAIYAALCILKRVSDQLSAQMERQRLERQQEREDYGAGLNNLRQHTNASSSNQTKLKRKRDLRVVGLSSDRFRDGTSRSPRAQPSSPMRKCDAVQQPVGSPKSAIISTAPAGLKNQTALLKPKTTKSKQRGPESFQERKVPMFRDARGQLHVYSMVDPSSHKHTRVSRASSALESRPPANTTNKSPVTNPNALLGRSSAAGCVCEWMDSLGVAPPGGNVREAFADGVLLSRIAAGLVKKYDDIDEKSQFNTYTELSGEVIVIPLGVMLSAQNMAQKRKNVAIAVEILTKHCGFGSISSREEACAKLVAFFAPKKSHKERQGAQDESPANDSVWELLDHIRAGIEASTAQNSLISISDLKTEFKNDKKPQAEGIADCGADESSKRDANVDLETVSQPPHCEKRRPYITNEQMQAVGRWLKSIDKDIVESIGKSLLQDPFRNGVRFCNLYVRAFANESDSPLRFARAPKTLMEVRQSLVKVFKRVGHLKGFRMPSYYLSSSAWEAIIMGDRQITYGILWYLWQYVQELENQNRKEEAMTSSMTEDQQQNQEAEAEEPAVKASSSSSKTQKNDNAKSIKSKKKLLSKVSPLLIDILATVLASERSYDKSGTLGLDCQSAFSLLEMHSIWEDDHPSDHDLYPQPSVAPMFAGSTEAESESPLTFQQEDAVASVAEGDVEEDLNLSTTLDSSQDVSQQFVEGTTPHPQPADPGSILQDGEQPQGEVGSSCPQNVSTLAEVAEWKEHSAPAVTPAEDDASHALHQMTESKKSRDSSYSKEVVCEILTWLKHLGIRLSDPAAFQNPSARMMEFQSGVLLCCIVEKVEYMRCIQGVCRKPDLTKANALHNISKALEILQQKKARVYDAVAPPAAQERNLQRRKEHHTGAPAPDPKGMSLENDRGSLNQGKASFTILCQSISLPNSQAYGHHHHHNVGAKQSCSLKKPSGGVISNRSQIKQISRAVNSRTCQGQPERQEAPSAPYENLCDA